MSALTEVKRVKNAVLYKDGKGQPFIKIERVRASYPHFGTAGENENDEGNKELSWGGKALLSKETHEDAKNLIKDAILDLMKANDVSGQIPKDRWFLKNGDDDGRPDEEKGMFTVAYSDKKRRPTVRDQKAEVMDDIAKIDDKFYGGCWISVMIRPWFFDGNVKGKAKKFPKRICAGIQSVQFIKDDTPFGQGRVDDTDQWSAVEGEDDNDGFDDDGL